MSEHHGPARLTCEGCGYTRWTYFEPEFDRPEDGVLRAQMLARRHSRECVTRGPVAVDQHHSEPAIARYFDGNREVRA